MYSGIDSGIADGLAIEKGTTVYIVDSGKENGHITFRVREYCVIQDDGIRADFIRRQNNDGISKGYFSDGLSSKLGLEYVNDRFGDRRLESGKELSIDQALSEHIEGGLPHGDGNRGSGILKLSALPKKPAADLAVSEQAQRKLSRGQLAKQLANLPKDKTYSAKDAEQIVDSVTAERCLIVTRISKR